MTIQNVGILFFALWTVHLATAQSVPSFRFSEAPTVKRTRVVISHHPNATDAFNPNAPIVASLVGTALHRLTGETDPRAIWGAFLKPADRIGVKVYSTPGKITGTRTAVVAPVIESLLAAGFPPGQIIIWDKRLGDLQKAGYSELAQRYGVRLAGAVEAGYDPDVSYENEILGKLVWGDLGFNPQGEATSRKSHVSKLITKEIDRVIHIAPLVNHHGAGVAGLLWGLAMASIDNAIRFQGQPTRLAVAVPELYAMAELGDKVALNIVDALVCQYQGHSETLLHYSTALNEIRVSPDPLALDTLSVETLEQEREKTGIDTKPWNRELLYNAALLELGIHKPSAIEIIRTTPTQPSRSNSEADSRGCGKKTL